MLRQRSKGKESDRFIFARSLEREKLIEKYTIKDIPGKNKLNKLIFQMPLTQQI